MLLNRKKVNFCGALHWEGKKQQHQQFSENIVFYVSKLKHTFWASFRGARSLIYIVAWSLIRNLHKSRGAWNWKWTP